MSSRQLAPWKGLSVRAAVAQGSVKPRGFVLWTGSRCVTDRHHSVSNTSRGVGGGRVPARGSSGQAGMG